MLVLLRPGEGVLSLAWQEPVLQQLVDTTKVAKRVYKRRADDDRDDSNDLVILGLTPYQMTEVVRWNDERFKPGLMC